MHYAARGYYAGRYSGGRFFVKIKRAAKKANELAKSTQIISKGLKMIDNPMAQKIADKAASMGYGYRGCGRRRKRTTRRRKYY